MKKIVLFIPFSLFALIVLTNQSCYYDKEDVIYQTGGTTGTCDTLNAKFTAFVSPLIASKCATSGCHNAATASAGCNLSSYTTIKAYITSNKARFLGSINQVSPYSSMPQGGSKLPSCDIQKITIWVNSGMLNN